MFEKLSLFRIANALAQHSGARQAEVARNVANADTPGFRARDLTSFSDAVLERGGLRLHAERAGHLADSGDEAWRQIDAPDSESPDGNTVSLEDQMLKAASIRHSHEMALTVYSSSLTLLRSSIGGRG